MRSLLALAIVWIGTSAALGQSLELPGSLIGRWESVAENCKDDKPALGLSLHIEEGAMGPLMEIIDHAKATRSCEVVGVEGKEPLYVLSAKCRPQENDGEVEHLAVRTKAGEAALAMLTGSDTVAGLDPVTYFRCP